MQHYDKRGQYDAALGKIDEAIAHTPTVIDLYSVKVCLFNLAKKFKVMLDQVWYVTVTACTCFEAFLET